MNREALNSQETTENHPNCEEHLLSKSTRSEHFSNKIDVSISNINPRSVEFHNISVFQCFQKMNLTVKPFQIFRTLQEIIEFHLIPSDLDSFIFIKCSVTTNKKKPIKMLQNPQNARKSKPYTVFEAPFPKTSSYCNKQQNPKAKSKSKSKSKPKKLGKSKPYSAISASGINFNKNRAIGLKI